jgi:hypothetical protein
LRVFIVGTLQKFLAPGGEVLWIHSGAAWLAAWINERSRRAISEIVQLSEQTTFKLVDGVEVEALVEALGVLANSSRLLRYTPDRQFE